MAGIFYIHKSIFMLQSKKHLLMDYIIAIFAFLVAILFFWIRVINIRAKTFGQNSRQENKQNAKIAGILCLIFILAGIFMLVHEHKKQNKNNTPMQKHAGVLFF